MKRSCHVLGFLGLLVLGVGAAYGLTADPRSLSRGGSVSWSSAPKESPNGWYYMYDDASDQPFREPRLSSLDEVDFADIVSSQNMIPPYDDDPYPYPLPDSFWYYGQWYEPGDTLYISPDGWVSFDASASAGFPDPPIYQFPTSDEPNALLALLWQDMDPTRGMGNPNNRIYYSYDETAERLTVEWYKLEGELTGNEFTFELVLTLGGQDRLVTEGPCGVVFSYHLIHFIYYEAPQGWDADHSPPKVGIEDQDGTHGIDYSGLLTDGRVIRSGYKKVFTHDVKPVSILSPGSMVLRWTEVTPKAVVGNCGQEVEHFTATLQIYDEAGDEVYNELLGTFALFPGELDTVSSSTWEPGEIGERYTVIVYTHSERDECVHNDTLEKEVWVHCDDTLRYDWNFVDYHEASQVKDTRLGASYPVDNGVLVTGGRAYVLDPGTDFSTPEIEVWGAGGGCGPVYAGTEPEVSASTSTFQAGWNTAEFDDPGTWVSCSQSGNIWAAVTSSTTDYSGYFAELGQKTWPGPTPCYRGTGNGRGGWWQGSPSSGFTWGGYTGSHYTVPVEIFAHLGFGGYPLPPPYPESAHDISAIDLFVGAVEWVEAEEPITPEITIANTGRQAEPDAGFFPVSFLAVDTETGDTTFSDSALIDEIGWLGDENDDPDTLLVPIETWTPEGRCEGDREPFIFYELIGVVRLGEVGPDESDHCPYNDTVRKEVTSLWSHDVGVTELTWPEEPDEPPDKYYPGSEITPTATVENFGFNEEEDIPVHLEVIDVDSNVVLLHNEKSIHFLNWRGNTIGDPYTIDLTFPTYTVVNDHDFSIAARTELTDDMCPVNDEIVVYIPPDQVTEDKNLPAEFDLEVEQTMGIESSSINFAVPRPSRVKLAVFDINGRKVSILEDRTLDTGYYQKSWQGKDQRGRKVAAGIYLVKMQAEGFSQTRKIVIIR